MLVHEEFCHVFKCQWLKLQEKLDLRLSVIKSPPMTIKIMIIVLAATIAVTLTLQKRLAHWVTRQLRIEKCSKHMIFFYLAA